MTVTVATHNVGRTGGHRVFMTARHVFAHCMRLSVSSHVGTKLTPSALERVTMAVRNTVHVEIATQVEMRGMSSSVYMSDAVDIVNSITCEFNGQTFDVNVPDGWFERVDRILCNWKCQRCLFMIPGKDHPKEDCDNLVVSGVMEL